MIVAWKFNASGLVLEIRITGAGFANVEVFQSGAVGPATNVHFLGARELHVLGEMMIAASDHLACSNGDS